MKRIMSRQMKLAAAVLLLSAVQSAHAELYKWVDAKGKVHYSSSKEAAGQAQVKELPYGAAPAPMSTGPAPVPTWKLQEDEYRKRQAALKQASVEPPTSPGPKSAGSYGGNQLETDKTRCALARDVKSGAARLSNGAKTDAAGFATAENDIKSFCR
jgi:hypothetical protein